jgi:hypothetical protein
VGEFGGKTSSRFGPVWCSNDVMHCNAKSNGIATWTARGGAQIFAPVTLADESAPRKVIAFLAHHSRAPYASGPFAVNHSVLFKSSQQQRLDLSWSVCIR